MTAHVGVARLIETGRRSGVIASAERALPAKVSAKGLRQGEMVETLVLVRALAGDCIDDLDALHRDQGLAALTDRPLQGSFMPVETAELAGLRTAVAHHHPYRYVAIRMPQTRGRLFGDGAEVKHFAVVSTDWNRDGQALLEWQRGNAGTVEHVNRVLKDELAAGV